MRLYDKLMAAWVRVRAKIFIVWVMIITATVLLIFEQKYLSATIHATPDAKTKNEIKYEDNYENIAGFERAFTFEYETPAPVHNNGSLYLMHSMDYAKYISSKSVIFTGMVKDGETHLLGLLLQIEKLACHFKAAEIIIMENGSRDRTLNLLRVWEKRPIHCNEQLKDNKDIETHKHIIHYDDENDPAPKNLNRMDRFVYYRNIQLDYVSQLIETDQRMNKPDYLILIDYDIQAIDQAKIFEEFIVSSQLYNQNIFCVCGMEYSGRFRDTFATVFKSDDWWCHNDHAQCHQRLQSQRFTKMRSCFGGLAFYRYDDIVKSKCKYQITSDLANKSKRTFKWFEKQQFGEICEHIAFHDCLIDNIDDYTLIFSRDSYLFYGWVDYPNWKTEGLLFSESHF